MYKFITAILSASIFGGCQLQLKNPEALRWYVEHERSVQEHNDHMRSQNRLQRLPRAQPNPYYQNNGYGSQQPNYNPYDPNPF